MAKEQKWIELDGSLYLFGEGGVTRVESHVHYDTAGRKTDMVKLFSNDKGITTVTSTILEIKEKLGTIW